MTPRHPTGYFSSIPSRFDFPRGPGAYAPRFCSGPLDFSDMGHKSVWNNQKSCFWPLIFIKRPFRALSLKFKCQTLSDLHVPSFPEFIVLLSMRPMQFCLITCTRPDANCKAMFVPARDVPCMPGRYSALHHCNEISYIENIERCW